MKKTNFTNIIEILITERIVALFVSDVRISLVNAGLGRSTNSRSLM